jgi:hypothetical protein
VTATEGGITTFAKRGYLRKKRPVILGTREFMKEYMAAFGAASVMVGIPDRRARRRQ